MGYARARRPCSFSLKEPSRDTIRPCRTFTRIRRKLFFSRTSFASASSITFFLAAALFKKCAVCFAPFSLTFRSFRKLFITSPPPFESERDLFFRRRLTATDSNSGCSHKARKMEEGWVFARPFFPSLFWGRKSDTKTFHLKEKKFELDWNPTPKRRMPWYFYLLWPGARRLSHFQIRTIPVHQKKSCLKNAEILRTLPPSLWRKSANTREIGKFLPPFPNLRRLFFNPGVGGISCSKIPPQIKAHNFPQSFHGFGVLFAMQPFLNRNSKKIFCA